MHEAECCEGEHTFSASINLSWQSKPNEARLISHADASYNQGASHSQNTLYQSLAMSTAAPKTKHLHEDKSQITLLIVLNNIRKSVENRRREFYCAVWATIWPPSNQIQWTTVPKSTLWMLQWGLQWVVFLSSTLEQMQQTTLAATKHWVWLCNLNMPCLCSSGSFFKKYMQNLRTDLLTKKLILWSNLLQYHHVP